MIRSLCYIHCSVIKKHLDLAREIALVSICKFTIRKQLHWNMKKMLTLWLKPTRRRRQSKIHNEKSSNTKKKSTQNYKHMEYLMALSYNVKRSRLPSLRHTANINSHSISDTSSKLCRTRQSDLSNGKAHVTIKTI